MTGIHAFIAVFILGAALDAGLPADALGELYGAADAAVEELESERGPEDEEAAWLRAELRHLEAKMPRDVAGLQAILARAPVGSPGERLVEVEIVAIPDGRSDLDREGDRVNEMADNMAAHAQLLLAQEPRS